MKDAARSVKKKLAEAMAKEFELDLEADSLPREEINKKVTRSRDRIITAPVIIILCVDMSDMDTYPDTRRKKAEYLICLLYTSPSPTRPY